MNGVLIVDKPSGFTSHDVVARARRILGERSIGHLGTLDPMATGVLPLVIGNLTRLAQFYGHAEKVYEGTIHFGFSTDTYDAEGEATSTPQPRILDPDQIRSFAARFHGVIEQVPPPFSAKKIRGVPAYKLARRQKEVILKPVQVEIKEFEILAVESDRARFRARVAPGTYVRSIAHELGQLLGCGAHLESLRRTAVAEFTFDDVHTLDEISNKSQPASPEGRARSKGSRPGDVPEALEQLFIHPRKLLPQLPSVTADDATAARIRSGQAVNLPEFSSARQVKVFQGQRDLIAIATRVAGTLFHAKIVLSTAEAPVRL
jgi:tRNA pseudouridine55 synthase